MLQKVRGVLNQSSVLDSSKVLLALSGGVDSVVLFDILIRLKIPFEVAHCNFSLRAEASDLDQQFVEKLAGENNIVCHIVQFDTANEAQNLGLSIQETARKLRYNWFEQLLLERRLKYLFTAHHSNDNVESMLYNLVKGTRTAGMRGVAAKVANIVRPLLNCTKLEILNFAKENGLTWREDQSNALNKYARNSIRNEVVPVLKKINPNLEGTLLNVSNYFSDLNVFLRNEVMTLQQSSKSDNSYKLDKAILQSPEWVVLQTWLLDIGFSMDQLHSLKSCNTTGKVFLSSNYELLLDRNFILIAPKDRIKSFEKIEISDLGEFRHGLGLLSLKQIDSSDVDFSRASIFVPLDKLKFPLVLRQWESGDAFQPFGMKGKKKVSDFLVDAKIDSFSKEQVLTLKNNDGTIIWLLPLRMSQVFCLEKEVKEVVEISWTRMQ